jgi:hypothetical protein
MRIYFLPKGATTWTYVGATTGRDGRFRKTFTAKRDGTWRAYFPGTTHFDVQKSTDDYATSADRTASRAGSVSLAHALPAAEVLRPGGSELRRLRHDDQAVEGRIALSRPMALSNSSGLSRCRSGRRRSGPPGFPSPFRKICT